MTPGCRSCGMGARGVRRGRPSGRPYLHVSLLKTSPFAAEKPHYRDRRLRRFECFRTSELGQNRTLTAGCSNVRSLPETDLTPSTRGARLEQPGGATTVDGARCSQLRPDIQLCGPVLVPRWSAPPAAAHGFNYSGRSSLGRLLDNQSRARFFGDHHRCLTTVA
jgi:hypothetical protein